MRHVITWLLTISSYFPCYQDHKILYFLVLSTIFVGTVWNLVFVLDSEFMKTISCGITHILPRRFWGALISFIRSELMYSITDRLNNSWQFLCTVFLLNALWCVYISCTAIPAMPNNRFYEQTAPTSVYTLVIYTPFTMCVTNKSKYTAPRANYTLWPQNIDKRDVHCHK